MPKRDVAVQYLCWYFRLLFDKAGLQWDTSNNDDVECIVDLIIEAVKEDEA